MAATSNVQNAALPDFPVVVGSRGGQRVTMKQVTLQSSDAINQVFQFPVLGSLPTNFLSSGTSSYIDIQLPAQLEIVDDITLEFTVAVASASVTVKPGPFWVSQIELFDTTSKIAIQRILPEAIYTHMLMLLNPTQQQRMLTDSLVDPKTFYQNSVLQVGTYLVRIPLFPSFFDVIKPYMYGISPNKFTLRVWSDLNIVQVGTSGNLTCTNLQLNWNQFQHRGQLSTTLRNLGSLPQVGNFLDVVPVNWSSLQFTAGSTTQVDIKAINGKVAFLLAMFRPSTAPNGAQSTSCMAFEDIGNSTMDVVDQQGSSKISGGKPIGCQYLKYGCLQEFPWFGINACDNRAMYMINFCDHPSLAIQGVKDGYMQFDGSSPYYLNVAMAAARTAEVYTITPSASLASGTGSYQIAWGGETTVPLALAATAATVQNAILALNWVARENLSVTVSAALSAAGTTTITLGAKDGNISRKYSLPQVINCGLLTSGSAVVTVPTALTTVGFNGGFTSSSYTVTVLAYIYKEFVMNQVGDVKWSVL